ncbi:MAG: iron chelate uptake ABC transporter family permease subunit [Bacteroidota bacterium]
MEDFLITLQAPWVQRALLASIMVGVMCGLLGCFIVLRNMSMIGDALAHASLPGGVLAFILVGQNTFGLFIGAVAAGLLTAVGITWIQQKVRTKNDAAIGIMFTAMFSIVVIGISNISRRPGVHLDLKDFLFGSVLGVTNEDLWLSFVVLLLVATGVLVFYRYLFASTFQAVVAQTMGISVQAVHYLLMLLLAFAVVASLRSVGMILVVAMLITPASTALLLTKRLQWALLISALVGLVAAILGLIIAIIFNTTPGPAMALTATAFYMLAVLFAPERGLFFRAIRKRKLRQRIRWEDITKRAYQLEKDGTLSLGSLSQRLGYSENNTQRYVQILRQKGFFEKDKNRLRLTQKAREAAHQLIRTHRLWETYLVQELGLAADQIHDDAERYEHLLSGELVDEMEKQLGYPKIDPHGSPIPGKRSSSLNLYELLLTESATINRQQASINIESHLWELGLLPEVPFLVEHKAEQYVQVQQDGKTQVVQVPMQLAAQIAVTRVAS